MTARQHIDHLFQDNLEEGFGKTARMAAGLALGAAGVGASPQQDRQQEKPAVTQTSEPTQTEKPDVAPRPTTNVLSVAAHKRLAQIQRLDVGRPARGNRSGTVSPAVQALRSEVFVEGAEDVYNSIIPYLGSMDAYRFVHDWDYKVDVEDKILAVAGELETFAWYTEGDEKEYYDGMIYGCYDALDMLNDWPGSGKPVPGTEDNWKD